MKQIEAWQTEDETIFDNKDIAEQHERECAFRKWYESNEGEPIITTANIDDTADIDAGDLIYWLQANSNRVLALYNIFDPKNARWPEE